MRLISLNTWGGKIYKPLINFIKDNSKNTDVFCFQEVFDTTTEIKEKSGFRTNLYSEVARILVNHKSYFTSTQDNYLMGNFEPNFTDFNLSSGLAIFINKKIKMNDYGDFFVFGRKNSFNPEDWNSLPRKIQYINFTFGTRKITVCNVHGIWHKKGKNDLPSRIQQSRKIQEFLGKQSGEKILCGDFNLNPDTKSISILEQSMINLIKTYKISTTRSKFYTGSHKFADYTFVSHNIKVNTFQVPNIAVSDHLPMILEFE